MNAYGLAIDVALAAVCALLTWWLGFLIRPWLSASGLVDLPNERSSHILPTLRGGGVAIMVVILLGAGILSVARHDAAFTILVVASAFLAIISFVDDRRGLPIPWRFACHSVVAIAALGALGWPTLRIGLGGQFEFILSSWVSVLVLFLWIVGYTSAFNFMDGINGIAASQTVLTSVGSGLLAALVSGRWTDLPVMFSFVLGGSAAGFLPHNFPRARMFMGDVGSAPLGLLLASLTLWMGKTYGWWLLIPLTLLHANFVLDASITFARRILRGERWYAAHREHFYQRLVRARKSHTFVTLWEMGIQLIVTMLMVAYSFVGAAARLGLIATVVALWLAFFCYCEMQFRWLCASQDSNLKAGV